MTEQDPGGRQEPLHVVEGQASAAPSNATIATADATVFTLAKKEKGFIQNLGTNPLFVRRAASASSSAFHVVLKGGSVNDDGNGGFVEIADHIGAVSVAGTTPRFMAWKVSQI